MSEANLGVLCIVFLSLWGVLGDICMKKAGAEPISWAYFAIGSTIYALSAPGWFFAIKRLNLSSIGILYPVLTTLLLVLVGVRGYNEPFGPRNMLGVAFGILSITLLGKF